MQMPFHWLVRQPALVAATPEGGEADDRKNSIRQAIHSDPEGNPHRKLHTFPKGPPACQMVGNRSWRSHFVFTGYLACD